MVNTDKFVSVYHYAPDSTDADKEGYVLDVGLLFVPVNIQPADMQTINVYGGAYGKMFRMYANPTASGILESDRLTVSGLNEVYIVKGKQYYDYEPGQHLEFLLDKVV